MELTSENNLNDSIKIIRDFLKGKLLKDAFGAVKFEVSIQAGKITVIRTIMEKTMKIA